MRCDETQEALASERDGQGAMGDAAREHLATCAACTAHAGQDARLRQLLDRDLDGDRDQPLSPDFDARFMARLAAHKATASEQQQATERVETAASDPPRAITRPLRRLRWPSPDASGTGASGKRLALAAAIAAAAALVALPELTKREDHLARKVDDETVAPSVAGDRAEDVAGAQQDQASSMASTGLAAEPFGELAADMELAMELEFIEALDVLGDHEVLEAYAALDADGRDVAAMSEDLADLLAGERQAVERTQ